MLMSLLLLVPLTALGLVLGMSHLEERLLRQPARHRSADTVPATTPVVAP